MVRIRRQRFALNLGTLLLLAAVSLSCQILRSSIEPVEHVRLNSPVGNYEEAVWLSDSAVAFVVSPGHDADLWDLQIALFDLGSEEWRLQDLKSETACVTAWRLVISRLPDSKLGFIETCVRPEREGITEEWQSLRSLDHGSGEVKTIQIYAPPYLARSYDLSPVNGMVVQAEGEGYFGSVVHRYVPGESPTIPSPETPELADHRLFSNYRVLRSPVWSPDGETVAVLAAGEGEDVDGMSIGDLGRQRWRLVLLDTRTGNQDVMLDGIREAAGLRWSPRSGHLAFLRGYGRSDGVWLYDLAERRVTPVWPAPDAFDFPPDRRQMVILYDPDGYDGSEFAHPVIIDVPYPEQ